MSLDLSYFATCVGFLFNEVWIHFRSSVVSKIVCVCVIAMSLSCSAAVLALGLFIVIASLCSYRKRLSTVCFGLFRRFVWSQAA